MDRQTWIVGTVLSLIVATCAGLIIYAITHSGGS